MTVKERVQALREKMKASGMAMYVGPSTDCHESEYVSEHFRARAFITGFTGSAGTAVIAQDDAGLWTDGRYFLQAEAKKTGTLRLPLSFNPASGLHVRDNRVAKL